MFYITNLSESNIENLRHKMEARSKDQGLEISPLYELSAPFQLEFITMHPENEDQYFTMTSLTPDRMIYYTGSKAEMAGYFSESNLHHHNYYEFVFVLDGTLYQNIENQRHLYPAGSCCLLTRNVMHAEEHGDDYRVAFLDISEEMMNDLCKDLSLDFFSPERECRDSRLLSFVSKDLKEEDSMHRSYIDFIPMQDNFWIVQNVHELFDEITKEMMQPKRCASYTIKNLILRFLFLLDDEKNYETTPIRIGSESENFLFGEIDKILKENDGRVTRRDLEETLHYSGDYLNKIVHKYTGLSIFDYGMTICMKRAADLLGSSDFTVQETAAALGFSNRTHFYKHFQKIYGITPARYRAQKHSDAAIPARPLR